MWLTYTIIPMIIASQAIADTSWFPHSYEDSRMRFTRACEANHQHPVACRSYPVPSRVDQTLTIDSAHYTAPHNRKLLVLTSGVHGAESFAGAAIQHWLHEQALDRYLRNGIDVLLVHALNPYGFKYNRRVTENNVNLNRNFTTDMRLFATANEAYQKLAYLLEPTGPVSSRDFASLKVSLQLINDYVWAGFDAQDLIVAIGQGQYTSTKGLEYGGSGVEPNVAILQNLLTPIAQAYDDVMVLDLHTGLGDANTLHLMPGSIPDPASLARAKTIFNWPRTSGIVFTSGDDRGFYETHGDLNEYIATLPGLPQGGHTVALTVEFGTVGNSILSKLKTINRLILENQGAHYGYASPEIEYTVQQSFAELFYPADPAWRQQVMAKAQKVLGAVLDRF